MTAATGAAPQAAAGMLPEASGDAGTQPILSADEAEAGAGAAASTVASADKKAAPESVGQGEGGRMKLGKRKVAMHIAYTGTGFRGLQAQAGETELGAGDTVEDVLARGLIASGGISQSNAADLKKVNWSRASRTDKGVHALSGVVAFKIECDPNSFEQDPEGLAIAQGINEHLPVRVRVLAVQRVNKGFNARERCAQRTYHYFLPASAIGLALDGGEEDTARLERLRACLALFEGTHPFHNYTKRRLYRAEVRNAISNRADGKGGHGRKRRQGWDEPNRAEHSSAAAAVGDAASTAAAANDVAGGGAASGAAAPPVDNAAAAAPGGAAAEGAAGERAAAATGGASEAAPAAHQQEAPATESRQAPPPDENADGGAEDVEEGEEAAGSGRQDSGGFNTLRWIGEVDPADKVERSHHRYIRRCALEAEPQPLVAGGPAALKVVFVGDSFMLHQIRHMVGAAAAVAVGQISLDFAAATLQVPARCALPLAPGSPLVLADSQFMPFPRSDGVGGPASVAEVTGERLSIREGAQALKADFEKQVLYPEISSLLVGSDWEWWEGRLAKLAYRPEDISEFLDSAAKWKAQRSGNREWKVAPQEAGAPADAGQEARTAAE